MKIIDRYIARELLGPFLFGVAAFTLIFISGQYLFKLTTLASKGAPLIDLGEMLVLRMVPLAIITFPMATLLATLLSFGRLSGDMEVVALMAGGTSFVRIALPAFVMGVIVSAFGLFANELLVPPAGRAAKEIENRIKQHLVDSGADISAPTQDRAFMVPDYAGGKLVRLVIADRFDFARRRLDGVNYFQFSTKEGAPRRPILIVQAEKAYWDPQQKDRWVFENGSSRSLEESRPKDGRPGESYRSSLEFKQQSFQLDKTPRQIAAEGRDPEEMSFRELRRYIDNLRDQGTTVKTLRELEVALYNKLAVPFTSMVFALIGTPLGLRRLRGGAAVGLGVSILIIFCYYILWHGMSVLGENGQLPPLLASWLGNLVGLGVGGVLVVRAAN